VKRPALRAPRASAKQKRYAIAANGAAQVTRRTSQTFMHVKLAICELLVRVEGLTGGLWSTVAASQRHLLRSV
jgi:hypothetical protein